MSGAPHEASRPATGTTGRWRRRPLLASAVVVALAATMLALSGFASRDPDSTAYAGIAAHLATRPLGVWIAPEWWGLWGNHGPFREHPIGIFVPSALLARTGYPATTAAYAVGALFSLLAVRLIRRLAGLVLRPHEADAVQWAALVAPVAFVYRIRANHEYAVLALLLLCVYATERSRTRGWWMGAGAAAAVGVLLVKGIFAIFAPLAAALWLLCVPGREGAREARAWTGIAVMVVSLIAATFVYEVAYRSVTGTSFLAYYLPERLGRNAGIGPAGPSVPPVAYNVSFYAARALWYGMPGSLALLAVFFASRSGERTRARGAAWFAVAIAAAYVLIMSLGHNKADRFIFPANFALAAAGAGAAIRRWAPLDRAARRISAWEPWGTALLWLALFTLTFATGRRLPRPKFWDG